jgi:hypothetical protein
MVERDGARSARDDQELERDPQNVLRPAVGKYEQHNYRLFQPLLYQVAAASLSPADIASPIRGIMRDARNVNVVALSWAWSYVTFQRGTRLITGVSGAQMEGMQPQKAYATPMQGAA